MSSLSLSLQLSRIALGLIQAVDKSTELFLFYLNQFAQIFKESTIRVVDSMTLEVPTNLIINPLLENTLETEH